MAFKSYISSLSLYNFRNHDVIRFNDIAPDPVVITGSNGAGKTNILEAISLINASKGLRGAKIFELNNQKNPDALWNVTAQLTSIYGPKEIMTMRQIKPNAKNDTRIIHVDGQPLKKRAELNDLVKMIWLTPPMQQLFIGSSSDRRSFFDQIVSNFFAEHSTNLSQYDSATRERLRLLKERQNDDYWLSALENNMFNAASLISDARMKTLALLNKAITNNDSAFPKGILSLTNEPIPGDYLTRLKINRILDGESGRTNLGPHLYDLEVVFKDKNMPARLCSTGEQKALLLNLILAQAHALIDTFKIIPILLFDEIISHLDAQNRSLLFAEILQLKTQSWLTGIDPKSFHQIEKQASFIHLKEV